MSQFPVAAGGSSVAQALVITVKVLAVCGFLAALAALAWWMFPRSAGRVSGSTVVYPGGMTSRMWTGSYGSAWLELVMTGLHSAGAGRSGLCPVGGKLWRHRRGKGCPVSRHVGAAVVPPGRQRYVLDFAMGRSSGFAGAAGSSGNSCRDQGQEAGLLVTRSVVARPCRAGVPTQSPVAGRASGGNAA
jgi:hypothetical protein